MKKSLAPLLLPLLFALVPIYLAWGQPVPTLSTYQLVVLLGTLAAFGLMLGQFWLSRLTPRGRGSVPFSSVVRWHKALGYTAGAFLLVHPVLMIARRFWVEESDPFGNLLLLLQAPALLPAVLAWGLLVVIVVLAFARGAFAYRTWRTVHGLLSIGFVGLATWHVVAVGRHSNQAMSALWIALAGGAVLAELHSLLTARSTTTHSKEVNHGSARTAA